MAQIWSRCKISVEDSLVLLSGQVGTIFLSLPRDTNLGRVRKFGYAETEAPVTIYSPSSYRRSLSTTETTIGVVAQM